MTIIHDSFYRRLGGEEAIRTLVDRIYHWMTILPEADAAHRLHRTDMAEVRARVTAFMTAWLGGPDAYGPHYGPPMMRQRHAPFAIGPQERDAWMLCFERAIEETISDAQLRAELHQVVAAMAEHMRNRDAEGAPVGHACGRCAA